MGSVYQRLMFNNKQAKFLYNVFYPLTEVVYKALQLNSEEEANITVQQTPLSSHVRQLPSGQHLSYHIKTFWASCSSSSLLPWHLHTSLCLSVV